MVPLAVRSIQTNVPTQDYNNNDSQDPEDEIVLNDDDNQITSDYAQTDTSNPNWLQTYSPTNLRSIQLEDPEIAIVIHWLEQEIFPTPSELRLTSPVTRAYWLCRKYLVLIDEVLYYRWEEGGNRGAPSTFHTLFLVPSGLRNEVLFFCHDAVHAGHLGITKTIVKLKRQFYWNGMSRDSREYVKACPSCNQSKKANVSPRAPLKSFHAGFPMERVHLDILGPFTKSNAGNNYILMVICQFTKWIDMIPIPDQSAHTVAKEFLAKVVTYFDCPLEIFTDQGSNFQSNLFKAFCELLEITRTRTTPYRPAGNGQIERYNRVVLQMVRCYLKGKVKDWDKNLNLLAMALRATEHRQTGFTPNRLMLGREIAQPVDLLLGLSEEQLQRYEPSSGFNICLKTPQPPTKLPEEISKGHSIRQKRDYDLRMLEHSYDIGDLVYKRDTSTRIGISSKLRPPWVGPYVVTECFPPLYRVSDRKREYVLHHDRLKICGDDPVPIWHNVNVIT